MRLKSNHRIVTIAGCLGAGRRGELPVAPVLSATPMLGLPMVMTQRSKIEVGLGHRHPATEIILAGWNGQVALAYAHDCVDALRRAFAQWLRDLRPR